MIGPEDTECRGCKNPPVLLSRDLPLWNATLVKMLEGWNVTLCLSRLPVTLAVNAVGRILLSFPGAMSLCLRTGNSAWKAEAVQHTSEIEVESQQGMVGRAAFIDLCLWLIQTGASEIAQFQGYTNSPVPVSKSCSSGTQQLPKNGEYGAPRQNEWIIDDMSRSPVTFVVSATSLILRLSLSLPLGRHQPEFHGCECCNGRWSCAARLGRKQQAGGET